MKVNRNYRFVLTNIPNSMLETGEVRIDNEEITGERMFASECHYYAEKISSSVSRTQQSATTWAATTLTPTVSTKRTNRKRW